MNIRRFCNLLRFSDDRHPVIAFRIDPILESAIEFPKKIIGC